MSGRTRIWKRWTRGIARGWWETWTEESCRLSLQSARKLCKTERTTRLARSRTGKAASEAANWLFFSVARFYILPCFLSGRYFAKEDLINNNFVLNDMWTRWLPDDVRLRIFFHELWGIATFLWPQQVSLIKYLHSHIMRLEVTLCSPRSPEVSLDITFKERNRNRNVVEKSAVALAIYTESIIFFKDSRNQTCVNAARDICRMSICSQWSRTMFTLLFMESHCQEKRKRRQSRSVDFFM